MSLDNIKNKINKLPFKASHIKGLYNAQSNLGKAYKTAPTIGNIVSSVSSGLNISPQTLIIASSLLTATAIASVGYYIYKNNDESTKKNVGKVTYIASYFVPGLNPTLETLTNQKILPAEKLSLEYIAPKVKQAHTYYKIGASNLYKATAMVYCVKNLASITANLTGVRNEYSYAISLGSIGASIGGAAIYSYINPKFKATIKDAGLALGLIRDKSTYKGDDKKIIAENLKSKDLKQLSYFENIGDNIHQQLSNYGDNLEKKISNSWVGKTIKSTASATSKLIR